MTDNAIPVAEWLAEGRRLFGDDYLLWRFQCPVCKHIQTPNDFQAIGEDIQSTYQSCIGRFLPDKARDFASKPAKDGTLAPCDFAAFGLFPAGTRSVIPESGGREVRVFPFAPLEAL